MSDNSTKTLSKVLIVDDVEVNRFVLANIMKSMGCDPVTAENGVQALEMLKEFKPALILLDISMPEMDGYEMASIVKNNVLTRDIPIIFISAYDEVDDIVKGFEIGGEDYIIKTFIPEVVKARTGVHLRFSEVRKNLEESNSRLQASLSNQLKQIETEKKAVLYAMANLARSNSLYGDSYFERLKYNCRLVAQAMQISSSYEDQITDVFIDTIETAAPLCDLGNVAVPKMILQKKNKLTEEEIEIMRSHVNVGAKILRDIALSQDYNDFVDMAADIANYHHENWDGSGYPSSKVGDDIPLSAQIVAIVSVYCALTSDRAYRVSYTKEEAMRIIESDSGSKFNPEIYDVCRKISRQFK